MSGPPWRECQIGAEVGDAARLERYYGLHRRIARVLPARLRPLVRILVLNPHASLSILPGRAEPDRTRLQRCCIASLDEETALSEADRAFLHRALTRINPPADPLVLVADPGHLASVGIPLAISATSAAAGSSVAHASRPGHPIIGSVATTGDWGAGVVPTPLPEPRRFTFLR